MTKRIALFLCLTTAMFTLGAFAQAPAAGGGALPNTPAAAKPQGTAIIKGVCKDEAGKPLVGAGLEFTNIDTHATATVKTGSAGEYKSPGLAAGTYKVTLSATDGTPLFYFGDVPAKNASETVADFDMAKIKAEVEKSADYQNQRKQAEKVKQENQKIQSINALLQQAAQQKKDKQYDAAVATMEQAAAQDQTHDIVFGSLAEAYNLDKKYPQAEVAFTKAIALAAPKSKSLAGYHAGLALALLEQGKVDASAAECDKIAQFDTAQAGACYFNEGAVLTNQGNADAANAAFDKAIAVDPTRADAYYQKGVNLLAKATLGPDNKMVPAPGTAEALNKYIQLAPDGKYAQNAKDLLASIGASVQASYGTDKKAKKK